MVIREIRRIQDRCLTLLHTFGFGKGDVGNEWYTYISAKAPIRLMRGDAGNNSGVCFSPN